MKRTCWILILLLAGIAANCQTETLTTRKDAHPAAAQNTATPKTTDKTTAASSKKDAKAEPPKDDKTPPSKAPIQSQKKVPN